ncbi:Na+/H+ antiporter subunit E [Corynebacterium dentalis]|uniref:Na+/H+ antiporter subunit E n=1 Tax=Corynebacterium dentalis TaxID=2014528 RepID=UPI0028977D85|nr:Na+/H+ antiporter subunit E [Corynebacterium dentalis]
MKYLRMFFHSLGYGVWLTGQIIKESTVMAVDTLGTGRKIAPVVLYYPLRVTKERDIAAFIASITMTPGTLALGVTGPKEVDRDVASGKWSRKDTSAVGENEFKTHGLSNVQRFLAVHAMYGSDPQELLESLEHMEEKLVPSVKSQEITVDVKLLVERGRPGPRGFRGSRGGRQNNETVFDAEKLDSTPHAAAFVAAILAQDDEERNPEDLPNMNRQERYEVARRNAERARTRNDQSPKTGHMQQREDPDQTGETKPEETMYDPLYPKENLNRKNRRKR